MDQGRLLILDDDLLVGQTLANVAQDVGFDTRLTSTAKEFFVVLDQWNPTHIVVDLVMPDMDGVEVMRLLAERACRARIIISSGVGSRILDAARRSAAEHGLDIAGVLSKPFRRASAQALLAAHGTAKPLRVAAKRGSESKFEVTEAALRQALDGHEFQLVYQPKIQCKTRVVAGFEALVRWYHPTAGVIMPDQFIRQAENWDLIDALTREVADQALRWLAQSFAGSALSISINISARTLVDFQLGDLASGLCRELMIDPGRLIFELTESSAMTDPVAALGLLTRMRMKGFQLSIDDFGTGYSSMVQLVRLPFSEIKVDKSFVMAAAQSQEARTVTKSIVDLGHSLGLLTTAEGVEDAPTLDFLNAIGCDLAQGYFIARPMLGDVANDWMAKRQSGSSAILDRAA
jgi:EAL domain-containing protein (putative c-di-GMP-specific phosphodiesterase class I)/ActR/RegA family two-component response regulator